MRGGAPPPPPKEVWGPSPCGLRRWCQHRVDASGLEDRLGNPSMRLDNLTKQSALILQGPESLVLTRLCISLISLLGLVPKLGVDVSSNNTG